MKKLRPYKPGHYGKGMVQESSPQPQAAIWRVKGWDGNPHHTDVQDLLKIKKPTVAFHIDQAQWFYFHGAGEHHVAPKDPAKLAKAIVKQHPGLKWGKTTVEEHEAELQPHQLAMNGRPLRPFEQGAHLHVLDWAHETARVRFQAAGAVQVKAGAKAAVRASDSALGTLTLPSLEVAIHGELRKLSALGHLTVQSELNHQASANPLPIGLSKASEPPNLRPGGKGDAPHCGICRHFTGDGCALYGGYPCKPSQVCDSFAPRTGAKTLAIGDSLPDPGQLAVRAKLTAQAVAHAIWQAVQHARLSGVSDKRQLRIAGRTAGNQALARAASAHAGGAINAGRHAAATGRRAQIAGARYTSVLDKNTCSECEDADTGQLLALDDPTLIRPPNPTCASVASGENRCRCILVYQLMTERPAITPQAAMPFQPRRAGVPGFPGETNQPDRAPAVATTPVAAVGVGGS